MQFALVHELWHYAADEGAFLARAAGEISLDALVVPAVTRPVRRFRLVPGAATPLFVSEGGWHFPPTATAHGESGVRPVKAKWFGSADHLKRLREEAGRRGLRFVLRVDVRGIPGLLEREPRLVHRTAWGQVDSRMGACVLNPELRALLRDTLADLRRYEPAEVELVGWEPDVATLLAGDSSCAWNSTLQRVLDTCFCPACRQIAEQADWDVERLVRKIVDGIAGIAQSYDNATELCAALDAYIRVRQEAAAEWLRRLAERKPAGTCVLVREHLEGRETSVDSGAPWMMRLPSELTESSAWSAALAEACDGAVGVSLPAWRPAFDEPAALVRFVRAACDAGVQRFDFEGLDAAPDEAVMWLKQAVRFARREGA